MAPEEAKSLDVILFRLSTVEESIRDMRSEMRGGFSSLAFVSRDVYASEKKTAEDYAQETRKIAENARSVAWAVASLVVAGFGLMLALLKALAK